MLLATKMKATLNRTLFDKAGALVALLIALFLFGMDFNSYSLVGKAIWVIFSVALLVNTLFVVVTPIAKLEDDTLFLYAEVQPILFSLKPHVLKLSELSNLEIKKGLIEYRAVFSTSYGAKVIHGFPATSDKRVNRLLEFLIDNTQSEIIKIAYNRSSKPTPKHDTV